MRMRTHYSARKTKRLRVGLLFSTFFQLLCLALVGGFHRKSATLFTSISALSIALTLTCAFCIKKWTVSTLIAKVILMILRTWSIIYLVTTVWKGELEAADGIETDLPICANQTHPKSTMYMYVLVVDMIQNVLFQHYDWLLTSCLLVPNFCICFFYMLTLTSLTNADDPVVIELRLLAALALLIFQLIYLVSAYLN